LFAAVSPLGGRPPHLEVPREFFSVAASSGMIHAFHTTLWIEAGVLL
jgi:hypothetical protein